MVKADPSILQEQLHLSYTSRESQNEYAQPELFVETDYRDYRAADALILSVHGDAPSRPYFSDLESRRGSMKLYLNELVHILHPSNLSADKIVDFDSLVTKFKDKAKKLEGRRGREADIWKHQLHFLEDDASLPGRLRILEFLVNAKGMKAPTILDAIRVRQCGVVRWIVGNSLLLLDDRAIKDNNINSPQGRKLLILGGQRIPNTVSSGTFLAHACIEFDALQTLAWLVEDQKVTIDGILGGFNLLHACAFFGRMEILLWLSTRDGFGDLKEAISTRKGFLTASAVHIAVMRGHLFIADLLLGRFGCPTIDGMGRTPDAIATSSPHDFVKEWGQVKARPFTLGKEIDKLVRHLSKKSYSAAKNHINSTKCLSIESWNQADIFTATESLPSGKSFRSIVLQCLRGHNESFVLWLCRKLTTTEATWGNEHFLNDLNRFWDKKSENTLSYSYTFDRLDLDKVRAMVADDNEASSWISYCWNGTPFFMDPQDSNPIIWADLLEGDLASTFWKQAFMIEICRGLLKSSEEHARSSLSKGMPAEVITLAAVFIGAAHRLARLLECDLESIFHASNLFNNNDDRYINMGCFLLDHMGYDENHAIRGNMPHYLCSPFDLSHLHTAIAIEGYSHLLRFCNRHGSGWTASMEIEMTRIGALLSHDDIMSFFLTSESDHFESSYQERCHAAMLGAASAARQKKWVQLLHLCGHFPDACVEGEDDIEGEDVDKKRARREAAANSSLAACIVFGYLTTKSHPMDSHFVYEAMMKRLIASYGYSALCFLRAASILFETYCIRPPLSVFEAFMLFLYTDLKLEPWSTEAMQCSRTIFDSLSFLSRVVDKEGGEERAVNWVKTLEDWGVDIQEIDKEDIPSCKESFLEKISSLKEKQLETWAKLDMIKQGSSLSDIKEAFEAKSLHLNMRDRGGLHLSHVAAVHNRVDVLQWLVEAQHVSLHDLDHQKRTVLDVAIASKADAAAAWIKDRNAKAKISAFLRNYFRKSLSLRRKARLIAGAARLQAVHRGRVTRKRYRGLLLVQVEESKRYSTIWAGISQALDATDLRFPSWSSLRNLNNSRLAEVDHLDELLATGERLEAAAAMAAALEDENDTDVDGAQEADDYESQSTFDAAHESASLASDNVTPRTKIHLSADVVKWLRQADGKYRDFFVRRVQQLSAGDRSRILEKHLKGSSSTIYETYLEQKSGHRILWQYESADSILIWYVAKHKSVSRLMRLIDDSQSRSARQRISASALPELAESNECAGENQSRNILLNPRGNVPLKVYKIDSSELEQIVDPDWSPQLYLTHEERNIVEEVGTVLLLGRSGTGKTVCICNRMDLDRQLNYHNSCFTQLFIARSQRLSNYVKETVGECQGCTFSTFTKLVESLENRLPKLDTVGDLFLPSQQMNFARFKRDVHAGPRDMVDPMVAWTNIRTFLKGSIEALVEQEQVMTKEAFLGLGKKRCRLATTEREAVYDLFIRYQKVMERQNLWDYCDRITSLLKRLQASQEEEHPSYDTVRYTKIYVDEIQDYTQGEILLFFQLSGPGQLFLAGDPAQSVVEGVEFRFEEIRSVGYHVAGPERRELIPQKPKIVTVNFRSHSGVLDTAAAVLQRMFDALVMTQDEWIASGLENAELSEANDEFDLDVAMSLLEKSLILFRTRKRVRFGAKGSCSSHVTSVSTGATAKANK